MLTEDCSVPQSFLYKAHLKIFPNSAAHFDLYDTFMQIQL